MTDIDLRARLRRAAPGLERISTAIINAGGLPVLVGGAVRDLAQGRTPKDCDVEVYGLGADALADILSGFGRVALAGRSFGVIKLHTADGADYDFSLPRRDNKAGSGHKGFIVEVDPTMTPREAAARRDFTWNALALDLRTGEVLDFFGGRADLEAGLIRATGPAFAEDALRVLRGMQFAGRMGLRMADDETRRMCAAIRAEAGFLATERVWAEWEKWATKSARPSLGIEFLREARWLELYPAIFNLMAVPQEPAWHPEGDAYAHTLLAVDRAALIADRDRLTGAERATLIFAALLHDAGKPETTALDNGRIVSRGHAEAGVEIARRFMASIGAPAEMIDAVALLVGGHMDHLNAHTLASVRRMALRLRPTNIRMLLRVIEADHAARPPLSAELPANAVALRNLAIEARVIDGPVRELLLGRHLIALGMAPGREMGALLRAAFEAQLEGAFSDVDGALAWAEARTRR